MPNRYGRLAGYLRKINRKHFSELSRLFLAWLQLPDDFDKNARERLFFPLQNLLALPLPNIRPRPLL